MAPARMGRDPELEGAGLFLLCGWGLKGAGSLLAGGVGAWRRMLACGTRPTPEWVGLVAERC